MPEAELEALPELARVHWRPRVSEPALARTGRLWTLTTAGHTVPMIATAALLVALNPLLGPLAAIALAFAWIIPELYANRGASVLRPLASAAPAAERAAIGLLGDLLGHDPRALQQRTGLVVEPAQLGVWVIGEAGAVLVCGGRRVYCYCVKVPDPTLPAGDRIAHLLLALRTDELGFATVANLAFSGARWRLRRRLGAPAREALAAAAALA